MTGVMRDMTPMSLSDFEAAPFRFAASARIAASPDAVFGELGDPSLWFPMMKRSVWRTGATSGVDAQREVEVRAFGKFRERMLAWDPGRRVAFTMTATTSPLVMRMAEDWRIEPTGDGVRLDWIVAATPSTLGKPITPALRAILRGMFVGVKSGIGKRTAWSAQRGRHAS
jgi:hypothetical protein